MQFQVDFHQIDHRLDVKFNEENTRFGAAFNEVQQIVADSVERYEGAYEVTPLVSPQTLATREKFMTDDVRIKAIPFFDVGNPSGGSTVYIATMDEDPEGAVAILGETEIGTSVL